MDRIKYFGMVDIIGGLNEEEQTAQKEVSVWYLLWYNITIWRVLFYDLKNITNDFIQPYNWLTGNLSDVRR